MRVFGRDTAKIGPHPGNDASDLGLRKFGKGAADVSANRGALALGSGQAAPIIVADSTRCAIGLADIIRDTR